MFIFSQSGTGVLYNCVLDKMKELIYIQQLALIT